MPFNMILLCGDSMDTATTSLDDLGVGHVIVISTFKLLFCTGRQGFVELFLSGALSFCVLTRHPLGYYHGPDVHEDAAVDVH